MSQQPIIRRCPECNGSTRVVCGECGREHDCDVCDGTGYDPESIDLEKWVPLERKFQSMHRATCAWIVDGQNVGRMTLDGSHTLDARPFAKRETNTTEQVPYFLQEDMADDEE